MSFVKRRKEALTKVVQSAEGTLDCYFRRLLFPLPQGNRRVGVPYVDLHCTVVSSANARDRISFVRYIPLLFM